MSVLFQFRVRNGDQKNKDMKSMRDKKLISLNDIALLPNSILVIQLIFLFI